MRSQGCHWSYRLYYGPASRPARRTPLYPREDDDSHKQTIALSGRIATFEVEQELLRLPSYGVFDFAAFGVDRGTVTLVGYS
jgi:hypothetical protein